MATNATQPKEISISYPMFCAWCQQVIGHTTVKNSSGICRDCAETLRAQARALNARNKAENNK